MKLSSILSYASEIAGEDYTEKGFSHTFLWENNMVFLLSRVSVKFFSNPTQLEEIEVSTWENEKNRVMFLRDVEFIKNNTVCIAHKSGWVLTDPTTRKILRPSFYDFKQEVDTTIPSHAVPLGKISGENLVKVEEKLICYSHLDCNGHVYNAKYADFATDILPLEVFSRDIDEFRINYINEALLGDKLDLYLELTENKAVVIGKVGEKECFQSEFIYK